jgi:hypothetical protein
VAPSADRGKELAGRVKREALLPGTVAVDPIQLELEPEVGGRSEGVEEDAPAVSGPRRERIAPVRERGARRNRGEIARLGP